MDKKIGALCMLAVTVGIFFIPKLYFENIDTRLDENRQDYSYEVKIKSSLDLLEKKEMLINNNCIVDINYNFKTYDSVGLIEKKLTELINNMYFQNEYINEQIRYADLKNAVSTRTDFKLIYIDDDIIKTCSIKTCIFETEWFKGFVMYDIVTSDIYILYVLARDETDFQYGTEGFDSYESMFSAEEILNGKTINNILENMPWENETIMMTLFRKFLKKSQEYNIIDEGIFTMYD